MANLLGTSATVEVAGVAGEHAAEGAGVEGRTQAGTGVIGRSSSGVGVWGRSETSSGVGGVSTGGAGVHGVSTSGPGVRGDGAGAFQAGVVGVNTNGTAEAGPGVYGLSSGVGVWGESKTWHGVYGESPSVTGGAGVMGQSRGPGAGVLGRSDKGVGVWGGSVSSNGVGGASESGIGVHGMSKSGAGLWGSSETGEGMRGVSASPTVAAIAAHQTNPAGQGAALFARKEGDVGHAGYFEGHVFVSRTLTIGEDIALLNADCAEEFALAPDELGDPGDVMVLTDGGRLSRCRAPHDRAVAGVVSGAGPYRPAMVLDHQSGAPNRVPLALFGKVYCKVDADHGAVKLGDLLTTSSTVGHAMRATNQADAFGAVIGKALAPLAAGRGLIPVLVALQ